MSRSNFGWWGSELDDIQFARALAALGVLGRFESRFPPFPGVERMAGALQHALSASPVLGWALRMEPHLIHGRLAEPPVASDLCQAWESLGTSQARMEVLPRTYGQSILPWIVEQLSREEVGLSAVYVGLEAPRAPLRWSWPMRVGLLDDDDSFSLLEELRGVPWAKRFTTIEAVGSSGEPTDLLLLPWPLRPGLGKLLTWPQGVHAGCVVVLGGVDEPWERAYPLLQALLAQANAGGICIAPIADQERANWFNDLLQQLSHNLTLDVAFRHLARWYKGPVPLFFASRQLLENSRVSNVVRELVRQLQHLPPDAEIDIAESVARRLQLGEGRRPAGEVAADLEMSSHEYAYGHESDEASGLADLVGEMLPNLAEIPPTGLRWLQGQVFEQGREGGPVRVRRALRAGARHLLVVRIGPADLEWLAPPDEAVFPEHKLTWEEDQHELRVVFSEPNHVPEPQMATLILPRQGASSTCQFPFQTRTGVPTFQGRVIVLHRNRVLQTALLQGQVLSEPAGSSGELSLELNIESVVRPSLEGLEARQEFDLAFVANHTLEDRPALTLVTHRLAAFVSLSDVEDEVGDIQSLLEWPVDSPEQFPLDLKHEKNVELLYELAYHGSALYDNIVSDHIGEKLLSGVRRIQLVTGKNYWPIEFMYDLPFPEEAQLCPDAVEALQNRTTGTLENGFCPHCTGGQGTRPKYEKYLCPLGFWCMRHVIERHSFDPERVRELDIGEVAYQSQPLPGRNRLAVLSSALYAASERVDSVEQGRSQRVLQALQAATDNHALQVDTWEAWATVVEEQKPTLLVLLPHTSKDNPRGWPQMEIGHKEEILERGIKAAHVRPSFSAPAPVVLLLGCETLAPDTPLHSFTFQFFRTGAAIVLSTLTPVLGRQAGPVAEQLIAYMKVAAEGSRSFGHAMLDLRRQALAEGRLIVLTLVAYGDAEWRLDMT